MQKKKVALDNSLLHQTATFNFIAFIALLESQERDGKLRASYTYSFAHIWSPKYLLVLWISAHLLHIQVAAQVERKVHLVP